LNAASSAFSLGEVISLLGAFGPDSAVSEAQLVVAINSIARLLSKMKRQISYLSRQGASTSVKLNALRLIEQQIGGLKPFVDLYVLIKESALTPTILSNATVIGMGRVVGAL